MNDVHSSLTVENSPIHTVALFILEIMRIRSASSSFHSAVSWKTCDSRKIIRECIVCFLRSSREEEKKEDRMQSTTFPLLLHKSGSSRQGPFHFREPFNSFVGMRDELKTATCQKAKAL